jgi:hypothetical protein
MGCPVGEGNIVGLKDEYSARSLPLATGRDNRLRLDSLNGDLNALLAEEGGGQAARDRGRQDGENTTTSKPRMMR